MGPVGTRPRVRISECPFTLEHSEPRLEHFECLRRPLWMFHVKQIVAAQHSSGEAARPIGVRMNMTCSRRRTSCLGRTTCCVGWCQPEGAFHVERFVIPRGPRG